MSNGLPPGGGAGPAAVRALVVDDSPIDRLVAGNLVEQGLGWEVVYAENGVEALAVVEGQAPDLVLTDLHMPEMNGLQLVQAIRRDHPLLPVVLMTAWGNEEIAIQALQQGASSYVPKRVLERDLVETLNRVLTVARAGRERQRLRGCVTRTETDFVLENDPALVAALVAHLQEMLVGMRAGDDAEPIRVGIALEEALLNALYHGNLELSSDLRQEDDRTYTRLASERSRQSPYRERRIHVSARLSPEEAVYVVRDDGPGFDVASVPDPTDPANLEKASGRGLMLIRTFMDEVVHNPAGNQIAMRKYRTPPSHDADGPAARG